MVFQSYALYPHMNVYQNMAFGLKLRKFKKATSMPAFVKPRKSLISSICWIVSRRLFPADKDSVSPWAARSFVNRKYS